MVLPVMFPMLATLSCTAESDAGGAQRTAPPNSLPSRSRSLNATEDLEPVESVEPGGSVEPGKSWGIHGDFIWAWRKSMILC